MKRHPSNLLLGALVLPFLAAGCTDGNGLFSLGGNGGGPVSPGDPTSDVKPTFGPTVTLASPPPPISGGTLLATADSIHAVASDPDRDRIWVVDVSRSPMTVSAEVVLDAGAEPGRVVDGAPGEALVILRGTGAVASLDYAAGKVTSVLKVCAAPRGIAVDASKGVYHVACAGGELVTVSMMSRSITRTVMLERDVRDVVVSGGRLWVSKFRSAEVLSVDDAGQIAGRNTPSSFRASDVRSGALFEPAVAWRMVGLPSGGVALVHQRGQSGEGQPVSTATAGGYGSSTGSFTDCPSSIVHSTVTTIGMDGTSHSVPMLAEAVIPVDVAVSQSGSQFAVVAAGNSKLSGKPGVFVIPANSTFSAQSCFPRGTANEKFPSGQPVAAAFLSDGRLLVQSREPSMLQAMDDNRSVSLGSVTREDTGHAIFHSNSGGDLACASCHPEGGEDGRTWVFAPLGPRRTQSLRGGGGARAPFHWDGSLKDMRALVDEVLIKRMSGPSLEDDQRGALSTWLNTSPLIPKGAPADAAAVARGQKIFSDPQGADCASCHFDDHYASAKIVDVGTGGSFHVPSLINVGDRAPFLHNGCAETLRDRFSSRCGGGDAHGRTSQLSAANIGDLVAFLNTL